MNGSGLSMMNCLPIDLYFIQEVEVRELLDAMPLLLMDMIMGVSMSIGDGAEHLMAFS